VRRLESELLYARENCHIDSRGVKNEVRDRISGLENSLALASRDDDAETQELIDARAKLSAECKSGNKQSCQKLDQVNHELESRAGFR